jgi:hypothetical protein
MTKPPLGGFVMSVVKRETVNVNRSSKRFEDTDRNATSIHVHALILVCLAFASHPYSPPWWNSRRHEINSAW